MCMQYLVCPTNGLFVVMFEQQGVSGRMSAWICALESTHNEFWQQLSEVLHTSQTNQKLKFIQRLYHCKLISNFVWSWGFKCSVDTYTTGLSITKCYFVTILPMWALLHNKLEKIKGCDEI